METLTSRITPLQPYPLTPLQHGLLVQSLRAPGAGVNVEQLVCGLREAVDAERLAAAWAAVVRRHEVLRTRFRWMDVPEPVQEPLAEAGVEIARHDHAELPPAEQEARLERYLEDDRARGLDLARAPAMRLALLTRAADDHVLVWSFHHVLLDGRSVTHLLREVFTLYDHDGDGAPPLPERRPFREHVAWLRGRDPASDRAYWAGALCGIQAPEPLPPLRAAPRDPAREPPFGERELRLSPAATAALRAFEAEHGIWMNTLVQGAWALLLGRCTDRDEAVFGVVRAGRAAAAEGAEGMVGMLLNTVPVRIPLPGGARVADWLSDVGRRTAALLAHEHADPTDIARWSGLPAGAALFDTILDYQPQPLDAPFRNLGGKWKGRGFRMHRRPGVPLAVAVTGESPLRVRMGYDAERFDAAAVDRMLGHFAHLLEEIAGDPGRRLGALEILDAQEQRQVLEGWNPPPAPYPSDQSIPRLFAEQAARTPDAPAVLYDGGALTYGELDERADRLAHRLVELGVGPEVRVGICLERSPELVVAMLAVLRAAGAYVPLDPGYPAERLEWMIADAGVAAVLTREPLRARLPVPPGVPVVEVDVDVDGAGPDVAAWGTRSIDGGAGPDSLAYVIYTSGSTGTPKGVAVEHRAVVRLVKETDYVRLGPADRVAFASNVSFDAATFEVWGALLNGGALVIVPGEMALSPERLARAIAEQSITTLFLTTALFNLVARELPHAFAPLRWLLFGGEAVDPAAVRRVLAAGAPRNLLHVYGPTENTTFSAWHPVAGVPDGARTVPIGRAVAHSTLRVLDRALRTVPAGVPGELYLGGDGVARGYLGRPALTAERFLPDPFAPWPGARMYRTGDQVRWKQVRECESAKVRKGERDDDSREEAPAFALEYLARLDAQVKIRGFRIEPGEVEAALRSHPDVAECAVAVREDAPGERRLVAYVAGRTDAEALRTHLRRALPEYMVPAAFVLLDSLPLTPNGKVDRRALPDPGAAAAGEDYVAPRNEMEAALAEIWAGVLGRERVGVRDGFLDIGGHSLLATRVVARIGATLGVEVGVAELFEHPTIEALAARLSARLPPGDGRTISDESSPHRLLALVDDLSDAELDRLLQAGT